MCQNLISNIRYQLSAIYQQSEIESITKLLLQKIGNISAIEIALNNFDVSTADLIKINSALERLKCYEPIQYVLGETEFVGLKFFIDNRALIPRPETEELVEWVLNSEQKPNFILDICTGSGCIAVSLAKNLPYAKVSALDISLDAMDLAKQNAELNGVSVDFFQYDILQNADFCGKFDLITANPPYIVNAEKTEISRNVLDYEPHNALFVDDETPLVFYEKIAEFAQEHLNPNGQLFFEINQKFGNQAIELLKNYSFGNIELNKDISGNDRMIKCVKIT